MNQSDTAILIQIAEVFAGRDGDDLTDAETRIVELLVSRGFLKLKKKKLESRGWFSCLFGS